MAELRGQFGSNFKPGLITGRPLAAVVFESDSPEFHQSNAESFRLISFR